MGIRVVLDFSCFFLPPLVLHQSKVGLDFCLEGLESLTLGNGGRVILPLDVRLVLGMEGFVDLLVIHVEPVFMRSGFCSKDLWFRRSDHLGAFHRALLGTELSGSDSSVVGGPGSLGSVCCAPSLLWS